MPVVNPAALADRLAVRELVNVYAHHADRRNAAGQAVAYGLADEVIGGVVGGSAGAPESGTPA